MTLGEIGACDTEGDEMLFFGRPSMVMVARPGVLPNSK